MYMWNFNFIEQFCISCEKTNNWSFRCTADFDCCIFLIFSMTGSLRLVCTHCSVVFTLGKSETCEEISLESWVNFLEDLLEIQLWSHKLCQCNYVNLPRWKRFKWIIGVVVMEVKSERQNAIQYNRAFNIMWHLNSRKVTVCNTLNCPICVWSVSFNKCVCLCSLNVFLSRFSLIFWTIHLR